MINSMSYKGYTASMVFDTEGKIIVGRILDIDDIIAFHGESVAEFESNFHAAIEDNLAASQKLGSAPERPASGNVMLRIAPEIDAAALKAAGCRVVEGAGSSVTFEFGGRKMSLHRPHPGKEALRYRVLAVREFVERMGIQP